MIVEWSLIKLNPYNSNPQQLEPPAISNLFNSAPGQILTNFPLVTWTFLIPLEGWSYWIQLLNKNNFVWSYDHLKRGTFRGWCFTTRNTAKKIGKYSNILKKIENHCIVIISLYSQRFRFHGGKKRGKNEWQNHENNCRLTI